MADIDYTTSILNWPGPLLQFNTFTSKLLSTEKIYNFEYMKWFSIVYNMCTQPPPNNHIEKVYNEIRPIHLNLIDELVDKYDRHFEKHDLDVKHKDFVLHLHYRIFISTWTHRIFSYIDRFHTPRRGLPCTRRVTEECWVSKGRPIYTREQEIDYMNELKGLLRAKQKLQLTKIPHIADDLYDIIIPHLSSNPVTDEYALETLYDTLYINFDRCESWYGSIRRHLAFLD